MKKVTGPTGNTFYQFTAETQNSLMELCDIALERIQDPKLFAGVEDIADKIDTFGQLSLGQFRLLNRAAKTARLTLPEEVQSFLVEQGERVASQGKIVPEKKPTMTREAFMTVMHEVAEALWESHIGKA